MTQLDNNQPTFEQTNQQWPALSLPARSSDRLKVVWKSFSHRVFRVRNSSHFLNFCHLVYRHVSFVLRFFPPSPNTPPLFLFLFFFFGCLRLSKKQTHKCNLSRETPSTTTSPDPSLSHHTHDIKAAPQLLCWSRSYYSQEHPTCSAPPVYLAVIPLFFYFYLRGITSSRVTGQLF